MVRTSWTWLVSGIVQVERTRIPADQLLRHADDDAGRLLGRPGRAQPPAHLEERRPLALGAAGAPPIPTR